MFPPSGLICPALADFSIFWADHSLVTRYSFTVRDYFMQDTDSIFLLGRSGNLERVPHQEYPSEDLLQDIVDRHPELIVGEQINPDDPPRLVQGLKW